MTDTIYKTHLYQAQILHNGYGEARRGSVAKLETAFANSDAEAKAIFTRLANRSTLYEVGEIYIIHDDGLPYLVHPSQEVK